MTRAPSDRAPAPAEQPAIMALKCDADVASEIYALLHNGDPKAAYEAAARHRIAALEAAAEACRQQEQDFLSPEYATGQPISSIQVRFACRECAAAILSLKGQSDDR
ncbi:MAG: hypothetical protein QHC65_18015 [Sphingomonas sp.]|nr:hypothetical protein [Sphingomonas sp.]MDX3886321.1 hypothetical protein [Sphingomonas sp.]